MLYSKTSRNLYAVALMRCKVNLCFGAHGFSYSPSAIAAALGSGIGGKDETVSIGAVPVTRMSSRRSRMHPASSRVAAPTTRRVSKDRDRNDWRHTYRSVG